MRERIIVGGNQGSGKTYGWLTIARMLPNVTFHVIDPDDGVLRVWKSDFDDVTNINYYFTPTWYDKLEKYEVGQIGGINSAYKDIKKRVKSEDWVAVEMLGNVWSMAQSTFTNEVFNQGIGEYFLQARKGMKEGSSRLEALKGWTDWQVINKIHNDDFMIPLCYQLGCHVYMTTSMSMTTPGEAGKEEAQIRNFYSDTLIRLDGQKHNPFRAQSIFQFYKTRSGWKYSTFTKDRGRTHIENEDLYDFALQYLVGVAGWKV